MANLSLDLPPLSPLKVFETAGRLENFTHAGRELGISQAAVSQQIRVLEADLGVVLFDRQHRKVALTPAGARLLRSVRVSLELIAKTAREIRRGQSPTNLRVSADLAFAHNWLMPRVTDFAGRHPHIVPSIVSSDYEADCLRDDIDVAILYGGGTWPGYETQFIFDEEIFPVCALEYLERHGPVDLDHLDDHVLLDLQGRWDWVSWSQWAGEMDVRLPENIRVREFNSFPLLTDATVNAQGVALGWKYLSDRQLDNGVLVRLSEKSMRTDRGYYLVTRRPLSEPAIEFCQWVEQRTTA